MKTQNTSYKNWNLFTKSDLKNYAKMVNRISRKAFAKRIIALIVILTFISCNGLQQFGFQKPNYQTISKDWVGRFEQKVVITSRYYQTCQDVEKEYFLSELLTLSRADSISKLEIKNNNLYVNYYDENKKSFCKVFEGKHKTYLFKFDLSYNTFLIPPLLYFYERESVTISLNQDADLILTKSRNNFGGFTIISDGRDYTHNYTFKKL